MQTKLMALCAILTAAACAWAQTTAGRIQATQPPNHTATVDPAITEIVFEFDQEMDTSQVSFQALPPTQVELNGEPAWQTEMRLVLPVRLDPGREYALGLNTISRTNMRAANGQVAESYVLAFRTAGSAQEPAIRDELAELNRKAVEEIRVAIRDKYSHRDFQPVDWQARITEFEDRFIASRTGDEFTMWFTAMIAPARDGHFWVRRHGAIWPGFRPDYDRNYRQEAAQAAVPGWRQLNPFLQVGEYEDGIRYLAVTGLNAGHFPAAMDSLRVAWKMFGRHPLILDLRMNGGGSESIAMIVASCFIGETKTYASHIRPEPSSRTGFTEPYFRTIQPAVFAPRQTGKVAVLMGAGNASSAESFICMMRQVEHARLFGEPSIGSTGNPRPLMLSNGVELMIPSWIMKDADGNVVQGKGIPPDELIETEPEDFANVDPVIEAALKWLRASGAPR